MTTQNVQRAADSAAVAVFDNHEYADAAVKQLAASGLDITKVTVIGRGFHTDENVAGFYNAGDRVKFLGQKRRLLGRPVGLLLGGLFMTIPFIGPVVVVGHFAVMVIAAAEGAIVLGGLSALGAALYSLAIPKDSVSRYEKAVKADDFLVIVHGTPDDFERARAILQTARLTQLDVHEGINMTPPAVAHQGIG